MVKREGYPSRLPSFLRILAKIEWKVPIHSRLARSGPTRFPIRSFISLAALLVKVRARMFPGRIPWLSR
jgi:hypothetical protein